MNKLQKEGDLLYSIPNEKDMKIVIFVIVCNDGVDIESDCNLVTYEVIYKEVNPLL